MGDKMAVFKFGSMEHVVACYNSPKYQKARELRNGKTNALFLVVEETDT